MTEQNENKKRKSCENIEIPDEKSVKSNSDEGWLRTFIGEELFDGEYRMGPQTRIQWAKEWSSLRIPQEREDLPAFVVAIAKSHADRHYGSYELQLLLTAINQSWDPDWYAFRVMELAKKETEALGSSFVEQLAKAFKHRSTFVKFARSTGAPCSTCHQRPKRRPELIYQSWKSKY